MSFFLKYIILGVVLFSACDSELTPESNVKTVTVSGKADGFGHAFGKYEIEPVELIVTERVFTASSKNELDEILIDLQKEWRVAEMNGDIVPSTEVRIIRSGDYDHIRLLKVQNTVLTADPGVVIKGFITVEASQRTQVRGLTIWHDRGFVSQHSDPTEFNPNHHFILTVSKDSTDVLFIDNLVSGVPTQRLGGTGMNGCDTRSYLPSGDPKLWTAGIRIMGANRASRNDFVNLFMGIWLNGDGATGDSNCITLFSGDAIMAKGNSIDIFGNVIFHPFGTAIVAPGDSPKAGAHRDAIQIIPPNEGAETDFYDPTLFPWNTDGTPRLFQPYYKDPENPGLGFEFRETTNFQMFGAKSKNVRIVGNKIIQDNTESGMFLQGIFGSDGYFQDMVVAYNYVQVDGFHGISFNGVFRTVIEHNEIVDELPGPSANGWDLTPGIAIFVTRYLIGEEGNWWHWKTLWDYSLIHNNNISPFMNVPDLPNFVVNDNGGNSYGKTTRFAEIGKLRSTSKPEWGDWEPVDVKEEIVQNGVEVNANVQALTIDSGYRESLSMFEVNPNNPDGIVARLVYEEGRLPQIAPGTVLVSQGIIMKVSESVEVSSTEIIVEGEPGSIFDVAEKGTIDIDYSPPSLYRGGVERLGSETMSVGPGEITFNLPKIFDFGDWLECDIGAIKASAIQELSIRIRNPKMHHKIDFANETYKIGFTGDILLHGKLQGDVFAGGSCVFYPPLAWVEKSLNYKIKPIGFTIGFVPIWIEHAVGVVESGRTFAMRFSWGTSASGPIEIQSSIPINVGLEKMGKNEDWRAIEPNDTRVDPILTFPESKARFEMSMGVGLGYEMTVNRVLYFAVGLVPELNIVHQDKVVRGERCMSSTDTSKLSFFANMSLINPYDLVPIQTLTYTKMLRENRVEYCP